MRTADYRHLLVLDLTKKECYWLFQQVRIASKFWQMQMVLGSCEQWKIVHLMFQWRKSKFGRCEAENCR
nr:hypothetical protein Iba_chr02bCG20270 [Ipomoea batatas]